MASNPKVFVVILNYNRTEDSIECIDSVLKSSYPSFEVLFIDNHSHESAIPKMKERFSQIHFIQTQENHGYAGGNNIGIRYALGQGCDYVFVLNNDTTLDSQAITKLVEIAQKDDRATILGPKTFFYDQPHLISSCGTSIDWLRLRPKEGDYGKEDDGKWLKPTEREILPGTALLCKKVLFEKVGLFNDRFFLVHEDTDLCLRNQKAGFKNILVPEAIVYHKISKTLSAYPFLSSYYTTRNIMHLSKIHASLFEKCLSLFGVSFLLLKNSLKYFFVRDYERKKIAGFFAGFRDYALNRMGKHHDS